MLCGKRCTALLNLRSPVLEAGPWRKVRERVLATTHIVRVPLQKDGIVRIVDAKAEVDDNLERAKVEARGCVCRGESRSGNVWVSERVQRQDAEAGVAQGGGGFESGGHTPEYGERHVAEVGRDGRSAERARQWSVAHQRRSSARRSQQQSAARIVSAPPYVVLELSPIMKASDEHSWRGGFLGA